MRSRIHWCPTGAFTRIPVHAAGIYDGPNQECCSDYVVSSYTPTLATLIRTQSAKHVFAASELTLSVVAVERAQDASLSTLWNVKDEVLGIVSIAEKSRAFLNTCGSTSATKFQLSESFQSSQFVHIACHGIQDPAKPLNSSFCVSDGSVSVLDLMKLDLKDAFFAFLSACETAKGDHSQPDQAIHLAATMLFVGFKSVVATLWCVISRLTYK
jgi:CHAT domain-containing protein